MDYVFAITSTQESWHSYPGELKNIKTLFNAIQSRIDGIVNIQFCTRPLEPHYIAYSSIKILTHNPIDNIDNILASLLLEIAPLGKDYTYLLRPMDIHMNRAYIIGNQKDNIHSPMFHNEWFSMPIGESAMVKYDEDLHKKYFGFQMYNVLYKYQDGIVKKYQGNNLNRPWLVYKTDDCKYSIFNGSFHSINDIAKLVA